MKTTNVESTLLRTVSYDSDRRVLQVEFHNGGIYRYFPVPPDVYDALLQAPSKGSYFNEFIRQKFAYVKLSAAGGS